MPYYAQIDDNDICFAVTQTAEEINRADMIEIDSFDEAILLKKYVNGIWETVPEEPQTEPELLEG